MPRMKPHSAIVVHSPVYTPSAARGERRHTTQRRSATRGGNRARRGRAQAHKAGAAFARERRTVDVANVDLHAGLVLGLNQTVGRGAAGATQAHARPSGSCAQGPTLSALPLLRAPPDRRCTSPQLPPRRAQQAVAHHFRGMYRSTLMPSVLCMPAADMAEEERRCSWVCGDAAFTEHQGGQKGFPNFGCGIEEREAFPTPSSSESASPGRPSDMCVPPPFRVVTLRGASRIRTRVMPMRRPMSFSAPCLARTAIFLARVWRRTLFFPRCSKLRLTALLCARRRRRLQPQWLP